jgi:uncharacterized repeat protein (TIGR03803 family)
MVNQGGRNGYGTVFRADLSGNITTLHSFNYYSDGGNPYFNPLVQASDDRSMA